MYTITPSTSAANNIAPFDRMWLQNLSINCSLPGTVNLNAVFKPYNGTHIIDQPKILTITNLLEKAAADATLANVINAFLQELDRQAKLANTY